MIFSFLAEMKTLGPLLLAAVGCGTLACRTATPTEQAANPHIQILLTDGWAIQSSTRIHVGGDTISTHAFEPVDWYPARVPSTVVGTLVEDKVYPDPFFGMNLRSMPGMDYPIGIIFNRRALSETSPYRTSWWYRKDFLVASEPDRQAWLNFQGINYRANLWLNGKLLADTNQIAGAYRTYQFNITGSIKPSQTNVLAVEIFAPGVNDLAINWVDWNPTPPDKNMGLWGDVYLTTTGPVALHDPQVIPKLDLPALDTARLTVSTDLQNPGSQPVQATLTGKIEGIEFQKTVALAAQETKRVTFAPDEFPQLVLHNPLLWWPTHVGPQNLHELTLQASVAGQPTDVQKVHFGIREISTELNSKGYRIFKVNGKPILIRGGGWAPDMFLRPSALREIQEIRYVKDMNLNAIRFEGKTGPDRFLDLCDQEGILVIAGWCCCDYWEQTPRWKDDDYRIAGESLSDQVRRIRNHPCLLTFWYGSDGPPNNRAETNYLAILRQLDWPNSYQSSASASRTPAGPTGLRMTGPYDYVPPMYWYTDTNAGGAYSFNTETSAGPAIPPVESLRKMLPSDHLWPIDDVWNFHAGGGNFKNLNIYTEALSKRLGAPTGVEDYAEKSQLMAYDGERAMFEAYARNKYNSTGVIQWMMNNAWPSLIWHLYDYYLRPAGGYFGTKKACEPLHIQYSYDDRSVVVVNSHYQDFKGLTATAKIYNLDMTEMYSQQTPLDIAADGVARLFKLPQPAGLSTTYFVKLTLQDAAGKPLSANFYWLSTRAETLDKPKPSAYFYTPTKDFADFTLLTNLPPVQVKLSATTARQGDAAITTVKIENPSKALAFFVHLKVTRAGEEILPVVWEDNYFELIPGEKRSLTATYDSAQLLSGQPAVEVDGWNVTRTSAYPSRP
jgi:exo-1,4-beta-D-glucosaminidase